MTGSGTWNCPTAAFFVRVSASLFQEMRSDRAYNKSCSFQSRFVCGLIMQNKGNNAVWKNMISNFIYIMFSLRTLMSKGLF